MHTSTREDQCYRPFKDRHPLPGSSAGHEVEPFRQSAGHRSIQSHKSLTRRLTRMLLTYHSYIVASENWPQRVENDDFISVWPPHMCTRLVRTGTFSGNSHFFHPGFLAQGQIEKIFQKEISQERSFTICTSNLKFYYRSTMHRAVWICNSKNVML